MIDYNDTRAVHSVRATIEYVVHRIFLAHLEAYALVIALACLIGMAIIR